VSVIPWIAPIVAGTAGVGASGSSGSTGGTTAPRFCGVGGRSVKSAEFTSVSTPAVRFIEVVTDGAAAAVVSYVFDVP
jgi:hypothetical protein